MPRSIWRDIPSGRIRSSDLNFSNFGSGPQVANDFFGSVNSGPIPPIYIGAAGQSSKYLGVRLETELYVGSGNLWP